MTTRTTTLAVASTAIPAVAPLDSDVLPEGISFGNITGGALDSVIPLRYAEQLLAVLKATEVVSSEYFYLGALLNLVSL